MFRVLGFGFRGLVLFCIFYNFFAPRCDKFYLNSRIGNVKYRRFESDARLGNVILQVASRIVVFGGMTIEMSVSG